MPTVCGILGRVRDAAYDEQVLRVVESIPPGRVMSYGDVAEYLGSGGPRQVGQVMARGTGDLPWWRVIRADGSPPPGLEDECVQRWREEGVPLRPDGRRADMPLARWDGRPVAG
jgi:alkylated DNA nucleotide flippase Atl1